MQVLFYIIQKEFKQIFPQPGWVEHDARRIWTDTVDCVREVLIIVFSLGGLAISVTGIVLGWRRLQRGSGRRRAPRRLKKTIPIPQGETP